MSRVHLSRPVALISVLALLLSIFAIGRLYLAPSGSGEQRLPWAAQEFIDESNRGGEPGDEEREHEEGTQGTVDGGAGGESAEALTAAQQWAEARTAPGIVAPGAYSAAFASLTSLPSVGGAWQEITRVPYDADDPDYRDFYSNSSGGSGLVTGRITAIAADGAGHVYVGGADGGVWRSSTGGGNWTPIADQLPTQSSGDLQLDRTGALWYATGEANTGGTTYAGTGVYRLANPAGGVFTVADRVGGVELESTTINAIRIGSNDVVWVATLRGIWRHSLTGNEAWHLAFAPSPSYMPGGANASAADAAYKNIVNDLLIDPRNPNHVLAAVGWRSGDAYNGFYETTDGGAHWRKVNPTGGLDKADIGNVSFAMAADGSKLYAMNQSPKLINSNASIPMTYLDGIYVSNKGTLAGPWTRIASADKLAASGSALDRNNGVGYRPGIQAWYNQFLLVDPSDANHVIAGLEEVFETTDGGTQWNAVGPYWNFTFRCWGIDAVYPPNGSPNRCPQTTHSDQHSVAVGTYNGTQYLYVGNDGGIYRRPLHGHVNRSGHATDWQSLNDGTIDALQYYAIGVGALAGSDGNRPDLGSGDQVLVSGGLQDNGGSLLRPGSGKMVSNYGGDGGDVLVDPNDGCNIVQEYTNLRMRLTQTCANPPDFNTQTTFNVAPPQGLVARFIAPFAASGSNIDEWVAGGNSLWFQDHGFAIRSPGEWQRIYTFGPAVRQATAVAMSEDTILAGWCGSCNNVGFSRGLVVGTRGSDGAWSFTEVVPATDQATMPNRYIAGVAIDPNDENHLLVAINGFGRRFTEGPGAGIGHVYESTDHGATWSLADAGSFPDVPANSVRVLPSGGVVVGTDLGVLHRAPGATAWTRLGNNFPVTVAIDVEYSPTDGMVYVGTHGRGIWRISASGL